MLHTLNTDSQHSGTDYFGRKHVCTNETRLHQRKKLDEGQFHHHGLTAETIAI